MGEESAWGDTRVITLGISAEGPTERNFVSHVLAPHLLNFNVHARAVDLGGNVSLERIKRDLRPLMHQCDRVTTLYDYYGFKHRGERTAEQLVEAIGALVDEQSRWRFLPYIQMYEFEALLFAVPQQVAQTMGGGLPEAEVLAAAVRQKGCPELVNDSWETKPSRRIEQLFPGYRKPLHGIEILNTTGLGVIRQECPRFNAWVTQLEQLGQQTA